MIGFAVCGSFCNFRKSITLLRSLVERGYDVLPIMSYNAHETDTRFGRSGDFNREIAELCGKEPIVTIKDAEPLGPKLVLDLLMICPCTGNTLAKLAAGITDTPVTMAAKAHLRGGRPLLIALASNDALSANLKNIGIMSEKKNVYFVPLVQDDPVKKPYSLVCDFSKAEEALRAAEKGTQLRPLFLS